MQTSYAEYSELAVSLATKAGAMIKEAFYKEKELVYKDVVDLVTDTDKRVEAMVISSIQKNYPSHLFLAEEV